MPRHGSLRASDADRESVVERLREAAHEGRLTPDELDDRVAAALSAVTYADLAATVVDLPGPPRPRGERRRAAAGRRRRGLGGLFLSAVRANPLLLVLVVPLLVVTGAIVLALTTTWLSFVLVLTLCGMRDAPAGRLGRGRRSPWRLMWASTGPNRRY